MSDVKAVQDLVQKYNALKEEAFKIYEEKMSAVFLEVLQQNKSYADEVKNAKEVFGNSLKENVYNSIQTKESTNQLEGANVVVEASKLREIPNENIVRIKMKLFEDGMEWNISEDTNGDIQSRLLPE